jgi:hypothetical protein
MHLGVAYSNVGFKKNTAERILSPFACPIIPSLMEAAPLLQTLL